MRMSMLFVSAILLFTTSACNENKSSAKADPDSPAAQSSEEGLHAPADAVPGSHEDWCGGHAVPESMCTRCNASLIPAFKASGDWCEEHKLPQSQCLICNPDLKIERPPKTAGK